MRLRGAIDRVGERLCEMHVDGLASGIVRVRIEVWERTGAMIQHGTHRQMTDGDERGRGSG